MVRAPYYRRIERPAVERPNERWLQTWLNTYVVQYDEGGIIGGNVEIGGNLTVGGIVNADGLDLAYKAGNPSVSDGPDKYSEGLSVHSLSSATGWPLADGYIETFVQGGIRAYQIVRPKQAGESYERFWASATTWSDWRLTSALQRGTSTSAGYVPGGTGIETAWTVTIPDFPSSSFSAAVRASFQLWAGSTGGPYNCRAYCDVSLDGGSTWTSSEQQPGRTESGGRETFHPQVVVSGAVTGDIQVRLRVRSSGGANTTFDDFELAATIGPDY